MRITRQARQQNYADNDWVKECHLPLKTPPAWQMLRWMRSGLDWAIEGHGNLN